MSIATGSAAGAAYSTPYPTTTDAAWPQDARPAPSAAGSAATADGLVGDAASATVTLSDRALDALGTTLTDAVNWPYHVAQDVIAGVADGVEGLAQEGWNLLSGGVDALAEGAQSLAHTALVDVPLAVAANVADIAGTTVDDAETLGGDVATLARLGGEGASKLFGSLF